jgi:hypothetical protein
VLQADEPPSPLPAVPLSVPPTIDAPQLEAAPQTQPTKLNRATLPT